MQKWSLEDILQPVWSTVGAFIPGCGGGALLYSFLSFGRGDCGAACVSQPTRRVMPVSDFTGIAS